MIDLNGQRKINLNTWWKRAANTIEVLFPRIIIIIIPYFLGLFWETVLMKFAFSSWIWENSVLH